jgi:imidazole glycerol-phosphate synthase subunit HisH
VNRSVAILDYGMGNLRSVEKAFAHVGVRGVVSRDLEFVQREADGVVLPGVGAFPKAMGEIRRLGYDDFLHDWVKTGRSVLGICLGMQLLFDRSVELGGAEGLGLLEGPVEQLGSNGLKVPHIGWNPVEWRAESELTLGLSNPTAFYHVHSFAPRPARRDDLLGVASYGGEFASAVASPPVYGVQFHPEKSGPDGLRLLSNFIRLL